MIQAAASIVFAVVSSHRLVRCISYEVWLRAHHGLAVMSVYCIWRHLPAGRLFPRLYLQIALAIFLFTLLLEGGSIFWRNLLLICGCSRASFEEIDNKIKGRIKLSRPLKIKAGQYINVWIPSLRSLSFLQSHPFLITSWSPENQEIWDFLVEPRRGLTRNFISTMAHGSESRVRESRVLFSGPHGVHKPLGHYDSVIMVASDFGLAAYLSYLKEILYGYDARKVLTRRIHVIWEVMDRGKSLPIHIFGWCDDDDRHV